MFYLFYEHLQSILFKIVALYYDVKILVVIASNSNCPFNSKLIFLHNMHKKKMGEDFGSDVVYKIDVINRKIWKKHKLSIVFRKNRN